MVKGGWTVHWNDVQQVPYATHASQWIGYDNVKSVQKKLDFLKKRHLGGGMIWTIDTDDFSGHCGEGKYPLLKAISKGLNHSKCTSDKTMHTIVHLQIFIHDFAILLPTPS